MMLSSPYRFIRTLRHFPASSPARRLMLKVKRTSYGRLPFLRHPEKITWNTGDFLGFSSQDFISWQAAQADTTESRQAIRNRRLSENQGWLLNEPFALPTDGESLEELLLGKSPLWRENFGYLSYLRPLVDDADDTTHQAAKSMLRQQLSLWNSLPFEHRCWSTYGVSRRLLSYVELIPHLIRTTPDAEAAWLQSLLNTMFEEAVFLSRMLETDVGGNHLIKNLHALCACAVFFQNVPLVPVQQHRLGWIKTLRAQLTRTFEAQTLADGMHFERTPMYHIWVLLDLLGCLRLLRLSHETITPLKPLESLADEMLASLSGLNHCNGNLPLFGDSSALQTPSWSSIVAYAAETAITLPTPDPASLAVQEFSEAGFVRMSCQAPLASMVLKTGDMAPRNLPAHQHADLGSFELQVGEQPILVDAGVSEYEPGLVRDYFRSAAAHNTIWVPGEDQAELWSSFRVAEYPDFQGSQVEVDPSGARISLAYENHNHHYSHKREVFFIQQTHPFWVVQDWITHLWPADRQAYSLLHVHPDTKLTFDIERGIFTLGDALMVVPYGYRKLEWSDLSPWREQLNLFSEGFNRARPGKLIAMQPRTPDHSGWILVPYQSGDAPRCTRHGEAVELTFQSPGTPAEAIMVTWEATGLKIGSRPPDAEHPQA